MWEAIASNQRRSWVLISLMGVLLVLLGGMIGLGIDARVGGYYGVMAALAIWLILWLVAAGGGDGMLLGAAHAREIQKADAPQLWNVVEEMSIAAGLPRIPRIYIIDDAALNAFAVGYRPDRAAVAVTSGLLKRMTRDELQGVIAHELGHVRNLDVRFMTLATVMVGAIALLADVFLRGMFYGGGGRRRSSSSSGGGQAQAVFLAIAIVLAIVAPLAAQMLYFACSRRREYLADASSARFTRYPDGLASALEKIAGQAKAQTQVNKVVAPLYIVNPLQEGGVFSLFSTHPPTEKRIRILRSMAGAGFAAYEAAFRQEAGGRKHCIGDTTLKGDVNITVRAPTAETESRDQAITRAQQVGALLDKVSNLAIIACPCGLRLKLPPTFQRELVTCPRCGRTHPVPGASTSNVSPAQTTAQARYQRRGTGWESFNCPCGHPLQVSPTFNSPYLVCTKCGQRIEVLPPAE